MITETRNISHKYMAVAAVVAAVKKISNSQTKKKKNKES